MRCAYSSFAIVIAIAACGTRTDVDVFDSENATGDVDRDAGRLDARADVVLLDGAIRDAAIADAPRDVVITDAGCKRDLDCDDGIPCTEERCDASLGVCVYAPRDEACDDGIFCNGSERCAARVGCTAGKRDCGDSLACTNDVCDEANRACMHVPDDSKCPVSHACDETAGCQARAFAHDSTTLYDVRLPSGAVKAIGKTGTQLTDCALRSDGTLFGIASNGIYRVEPITAATTLVRTADGGHINGADVHPNGTMYVAGDSSLYAVDASSGALLFAQSFPSQRFSSGDLAFIGTRLFASADRLGVFDDLVEFDLQTKTSRVVGSIGFDCVWGLAAYGTTLYGLTCAGQILSINTTTGKGTRLNQVSTDFWGAAAR